MERNIRAEFWNNKLFQVNISSANKQKRSFTFSNETPHEHCKGSEMGIKSYCKGCNELTTDKPTNKLFKIGKQMLRIPAQAINAIKERNERGDIVLTVPPISRDKLYSVWADFDDWLEDQKYVEQVEKKEADYAILKEVLRDKVAFGKANFGFAEYAIALYTAKNDKLRMRLLVEPSQRYDEREEKQVEASQAMVQVLKQIAEKQTENLKFPDVKELTEDGNRKQIEDLIEKAGSGQPIEVKEIVQEINDKKEEDELAELKALL